MKNAAMAGLVALYAIFSSSVAAQDSPLRCEATGITGTDFAAFLISNRITCEVVVDEANIEGVVLNRGNCPSPATYEQSMAQLSDDVKRDLKRMGVPIDDESAMRQRLEGWKGIHKFGDRISFTYSCANLIEYTFTVDGGVWVFRR